MLVELRGSLVSSCFTAAGNWGRMPWCLEFVPGMSTFSLLSYPRAVPLVFSSQDRGYFRGLLRGGQVRMQSPCLSRKCRWAAELGRRDFTWEFFCANSAVQAWGCSPNTLCCLRAGQWLKADRFPFALWLPVKAEDTAQFNIPCACGCRD